jgi:acetyltransferase-like isoleucine patch superfamily enzyme
MAGFTQRLIYVRFSGDKLVDELNSWTTVRWAICGHIHRCTHPVLVHTIPSLISNAYYRLAGAKIGKGVQINTINLNDPSMVTIEDNVVVGGGCIINGHLVEKGQIILSRITLKEGSLLGARVTIQPGVTVGKGAVIGTNGLVGKYKTIPAGEVWAGLPARCIKKSSDRI